jgi:mannose-6-phosphate isomerase-like protein (cupin superfamily)
MVNFSNIAASAEAVVVRSGEGQTLRWGPQGTVRIIAGASTTDQSFSIVESTAPPGSGALLHVHHGEAEAFYILDGTVELTCGGKTITAGAGDFVYTPKDVPHKFAVGGGKPARGSPEPGAIAISGHSHVRMAHTPASCRREGPLR